MVLRKKNVMHLFVCMSFLLACFAGPVRAQTNTSGYDNPLRIDVGMLENQKRTASDSDEYQPAVEQPRPYQEIEVVGEGARYTIGPGDILQIMVRNQPEFTGRFVVNDNGYIQYNFVGDVKAAGFTKEELKSVLREKLVQFVKYPELSVIILEYRSKFVYVLGNVTKPGKYPMQGDNLTLREAVIFAGLPERETSAMKRTRIIRETEDGPKSIKVNLKEVLLEGRLDKNYDLLPGDIVVVPQSRFHTTTTWFSKIISPLFQALAVYEIGFGSDDDGILR
jgi:protein involved in polysaccharide export with SLBB domain